MRTQREWQNHDNEEDQERCKIFAYFSQSYLQWSQSIPKYNRFQES